MDPTYIRDHPEYGVAGIDHIFRFPNGRGIRKHRHVARDSGWNVEEIRFLGLEVTNFEVVTHLGSGLSATQVDTHITTVMGRDDDPKAVGVDGLPVVEVVEAPPAAPPVVDDSKLSAADKQVVQDEADATARDQAANAPAGTTIVGNGPQPG